VSDLEVAQLSSFGRDVLSLYREVASASQPTTEDVRGFVARFEVLKRRNDEMWTHGAEELARLVASRLRAHRDLVAHVADCQSVRDAEALQALEGL